MAATLAAGILMGIGVGPMLDGSAGAVHVLVPASNDGPVGDSAPSTEPPASTGGLGAPVGNVEAPPVQVQRPAPAPAPPTPPAPARPEPSPEAPADVPLEQPEPDEPTDDSIPVRGTVVQVSEFADSYTVATRRGELLAVHAAELPDVGDSVEGRAEPLANGTFGEVERDEETTPSDAALLRGAVTWVAPEGDMYVVSGRGASILVGRESQEETVEAGAFVQVRVAITEPPPEPDPEVRTPPRLDEQELEVETEPISDAPLEIAAIVKSIDTETRALVVSVDSADEAGQELELVVDEDLPAETLAVDEAVIATISPREGEPPLVTGWADDSGRKAATDPERAEGDQAP